jgi:hypothetical protein
MNPTISTSPDDSSWTTAGIKPESFEKSIMQIREIRVIRGCDPSRTNKKPRRNESAGLGEALLFFERSVAQSGRPAEAGVVVPVVVRETEHLLEAYFLDAAEVKPVASA